VKSAGVEHKGCLALRYLRLLLLESLLQRGIGYNSGQGLLCRPGRDGRGERKRGGNEVPDRTKINTGRRWLRISIRALMALILIIACALGWIVSRASVQRNAVAAVKKAGGTVWYDFEHRRVPGPPPGLPAWRRLIAYAIGIDFVSSVTMVSMPGRGSGAYSQNILARLGVFK
jgi:hypothetical protein